MTSIGESDAAAAAERPFDRASALIESSLDCVVTIDRAGRIVEFNPTAERVLGWSRAEVLGRELAEVVIPDTYAQAHRDGLERYLRGTESAVIGHRLELPVKRRDGQLLTMELMVVAVETDGRQEFTGFMRDVTQLREAEAALAASQQRYEAIVRHSTRALVLCAPQRGESVFLAGTSTLGYEPGTPLDGGFLSLVHPDDAARARTFMATLLDTPPQTGIDLRLARADGRWILGEVTGEDLTHVPSIGGHLLRIADVTAERQQQRQLDDTTAQMRTLIDNLGAAVLLEDHDRRVLVANDALSNLFAMGVPARDLAGLDCSSAAEQVKHIFADPEGFVESVAAALADQVPQLGRLLRMADGRTLERDYLPIVVADRPAGHLWVYRDITDSIAYQDVLEDQNRALAELAEMKNEFVARASHELRSPLTSVVSFTEILATPVTGPLNEDQAEYVAIILRNAERLLRLIEDLLLMTKLESHTLQLSMGLVDPATLSRQVVAELTPVAERAGVAVAFTGEDGPRVRGDAVRLQQVVSNVLNNAVAYTPTGGRVEVSAVPERDHGRWRLSVSDTGVGIDPAELPRIFDPFFRASSAGGARAAKGSGLGLSIVRLIVDMHGGSIDVTSTPGVGTTIVILLPIEGA